VKIRVFEEKDVQRAVQIWNQEVSSGGMIYCPMTEGTFASVFLKKPEYSEEYMLSAVDEQDQLLGFISGMIKRDYLRGEDFSNTPGYVTFLLVAPHLRRQGLGSQLLEALQDRFKVVGKKRMAITYRNPVRLEWIVPASGGARHNNAPGVPSDSIAASFFLSRDFVSLKTENGMYLDLNGYEIPLKVKEKETKLKETEILIEFYDKSLHYGFDDFFNAVHGEVWRKTIAENEAKKEPLPVLVASKLGKIIGFAGPIDKEPSGRGWFNGIATDPAYERRGIASVLFCRLMYEFRSIGACYSTLFTDSGNPALQLYQNVGFSTAVSFLVLEKEI